MRTGGQSINEGDKVGLFGSMGGGIVLIYIGWLHAGIWFYATLAPVLGYVS